MRVRMIAFMTLVALTAPFQSARGQTFEIVPLPKTTIRTTFLAPGQAPKTADDSYVGVLSLPYNTNTLFRESMPPLGFVETKVNDTLDFQGRRMDVKRLEWRAGEKAVTNIRAAQITVWGSSAVKSPEFQMPMAKGAPISFPRGTLKFESVAERKGEGYKAEPISARGALLAEEQVTLGARKIKVFHYQVEMSTPKTGVKGALWLSDSIPGGLFKTEVDIAGKGRQIMEVTGLADEQLSRDLRKVEAGGFAVIVPEGWKVVTPSAKDEVFRIEPTNADPKLNRAIAVTVVPAQGKSLIDWANTLHEKGERYGVVSYPGKKGLGDSPSFEMDHGRGSSARTKTYTVGTLFNDHLYLIAHWQDSVAEKSAVGSADVWHVAASWRWLRKTSAK